jgi:hypothetical protein
MFVDSSKVISIEDCVLLADSMSEPFQDIHLITTRWTFINQLTTQSNVACNPEAIQNALDNTNITVHEYVDFGTTPPTVCVDMADTSDEFAVYRAFSLISQAIEVNGSAAGKWINPTPLAYSFGEISQLLNWH